jgi:predicted transcriptional regulator
MFVVLQKNTAARALGGEVCGDQIGCPGPGHSAKDRSLSVKIDPDAPDGFVCHSFSRDDDIECRDYVRAKLGLAPFKSRKRGPSFSARRRAWRDKLMATEVRNEFKIVGYLLSYHVNHQTCSTFVKAGSIARESGIGFPTVQKAFEWMEKSGFIKTGQRDDGAAYATLKLGNTPPQYLFSASFHIAIARLFARLHGEWLDRIFLSSELSPGDKLTAYAVLASTDPETGSCSVGYSALVKAVGICVRTAKSGIKNLEAAGYLEIDSQPGKRLTLYSNLRIPTQAITGAMTQAIAPNQAPETTQEAVGPTFDSGDSDYHEEGKYLVVSGRDGGQPDQPPDEEEVPW